MTASRQLPLIASVTGVVLAGGKSSRMGTDKAFVRVAERTLIERTTAVVRCCFVQNVIIANHPEMFSSLGLPVFKDDVPDLGPLGGIATALRRVETEAIFVVACDMPFLNPELIREMAKALGDFDAVAARIDGRFEPLHAVYRRRSLPGIESRIATRDYSVVRLLESLRVRVFEEKELSGFAEWRRTFLNVNTPQELRKATS